MAIENDIIFSDKIPEFKVWHFKELLTREVENLFKWEGLDDIIPTDQLEKTLINQGNVLFFKKDNNYYALNSNLSGNDYYKRKTIAKVNVTAELDHLLVDRHIYYSDIGVVDGLEQGVVIENMSGGKSLRDIIDFYATRLGLIWSSIDVNLLWQNLPPIYQTADKDVQLSLKKIMDDIFTGKPLIIVDKALQLGENNVMVGLAEVPFLFNELHKAHDQVLSDFRSIVGINTVGTVKESGVKTEEITANSQSIQTCLEVMYSSRKKACRSLNELFGLNVSVRVVGEERGEEDGTSDNRAKESIENSEF